MNIPQPELSGRLQKLMFLRVLFVSLLLGISVFLQVEDTKTYFGDIQTAHYTLIAAIYFLTFLYILAFKRGKGLVRLAYLQLLVDPFVVTAIIFATGGIESIFSSLYFLTIINGSIILYRRGGIVVASFCSLLYAFLLELHYYGIIHPIGSPMGSPAVYRDVYVLYMVAVNVAAFFLVAFLSSYVSEQARKSGVELKARQDDIVQLEALNEWIIRSITSGLITLDSEGRIILFNPAAEEIFRVRAQEAIGRKMTQVLPGFGPRLEEMEQGQAGKWGKPRRFFDLHYARPDGKRAFLRCSMSPLSPPEGAQKGEILLFQDLTELKQIEEEMKKVEGLALIGELAAGIAHEVRNPLASISGSIQMLREDLEKSDMSSQLMDIILREIGRLNNLVSEFLLFARPKQTKTEYFDLNQLIVDSLSIFRGRERWIHQIRVERDFQSPVMLGSDPEQIRQVLWNLFLNACDAMPKGGALYIKTETLPRSAGNGAGDQVRIIVRDTGEGFSPAALNQLFTPFFTTKEGGTGLGLAVVKRIVEGLKGQVSGRNHPEGGAEIAVLLHSSPPTAA